MRTKVVIVGLVFLVLGIVVFAYSSTHSWSTFACSDPCTVSNGTTLGCSPCPAYYPISNLQVQSVGFFVALFGAIVLLIGLISKHREPLIEARKKSRQVSKVEQSECDSDDRRSCCNHAGHWSLHRFSFLSYGKDHNCDTTVNFVLRFDFDSRFSTSILHFGNYVSNNNSHFHCLLCKRKIFFLRC